VNVDHQTARSLVASVSHWHHTFEIFPGITTPGSYAPQFLLDRLHLPDDLSGVRVLDIGTADGFFALKLAQRGAKVVAIDYRKKEDHGFHIMEALNDVDIEYRQMNVYDLSPELLGKFDIVLFLGVLYHLPDLWRALQVARSCCQERGIIFIESHVDTECDPSIPVARYHPRSSLAGDYTNYWSPNRACLLELVHDCGLDGESEATWGSRMFLAARRVRTEGLRAAKIQMGYDLADSEPSAQ